MISVKAFTFNPFAENTYLLSDESGECIIIDPGCYTEEEKRELSGYIEKKGLKPVKAVLTHAHIDHILGNNYITSKYNIPLVMHRGEVVVLNAAGVYGEMWGIRVEPLPEPSEYLEEGDELRFGNTSMKVLLTPGHSPASISFLSSEEKILIAGDVLFNGSIGRTDLPGGDYDTLISSIKNNLLTLEDDVIVYPGHGPETTIGQERRSNPFLY